MTEPAPGAGSDPAMLQTHRDAAAARRLGHQRPQVVHQRRGRRRFRAGAGAAPIEGATVFIVDADNPGYRVVRNIGSMDGYQIGGHGEMAFEDCRVGDDAVLGEVGKGFAYAQERLEPARLSHCMRFIGRASRAMTIAQDYVLARSPSASRWPSCSRCRRWSRTRTSTCTPRA